MEKLNELIRLWNSTSKSIATTNKTIGPNSFHQLSSLTTILQVPLPALHPSLPTRVIIRTLPFIWNATSLPHAHVTLSLTSTSCTNNFNSTSLKLNVDTKLPLIPDGFRPRNSKLVAKHMSRLNSSIRHDPPRNSQRNSLDHMKSLHDPAPIPSRCDFQTVFVLYTQYSMFPCWNQRFQIRSLIAFNPHPRQSLWMTNPNSKSQKYSTQRLTTTVVPANYCILSVGRGMKVLMKKLLGYSLPNSDMLLNSSRISTLHTQPNLALHQVFPNLDLQPSGVLHSLRITLFFICSNHSEITIYCRVISTSQDASGSTSRTSSSSFSGPIILCLLTTISVSAGPSGLPISQTLMKCSPPSNRSITSAMTLVLEANSSRSSSCRSADSRISPCSLTKSSGA